MLHTLFPSTSNPRFLCNRWGVLRPFLLRLAWWAAWRFAWSCHRRRAIWAAFVVPWLICALFRLIILA